eukprot:m.69572 g.69572  ORF g.69572 m.69572 type:complete len:326 (+) comp14259_c0_seq1:295-1272(+)
MAAADDARKLKPLLRRNREWARGVEERMPGFFASLQQQQAPSYMWIGCADSRVPANEILGLLPGEIFVHRNVANTVVHSDLNCLSTMQFAVDQLKVRHIIVCGHYGCGGVRAVLTDARVGLVDNWLRHVHDIYKRHRSWMDTLVGDEERLRALCELNVLEQCLNVCESTIMQDAWARGQKVTIHGWIYGLHNGHLKDLDITVSSQEEVEATYRSALAGIFARHSQAPSPSSESRSHSPEPGAEGSTSPPKRVVSVTSESAAAVAARAAAKRAASGHHDHDDNDNDACCGPKKGGNGLFGMLPEQACQLGAVACAAYGVYAAMFRN